MDVLSYLYFSDISDEPFGVVWYNQPSMEENSF